MEKIIIGCDHGGFALMQEIKAAFDANGIVMPRQQVDVHMAPDRPTPPEEQK